MKENSEFLSEHGITNISARQNNIKWNCHSYSRLLQLQTVKTIVERSSAKIILVSTWKNSISVNWYYY
jgi:hypothetical protein